MDFGDILAQWENGKSAAGKKSPGSADSEKQAHPMDIWLRINTVTDKDAQVGEEQDSAAERRRRLRHKKPEARIDIHGLTRDEAWPVLDQFFTNSYNRGLKKVLIIHGKGNHSQDKAVLKHCVRDFIEMCPFAGESGQSDTGGSGATWVLLKYKSENS